MENRRKQSAHFFWEPSICSSYSSLQMYGIIIYIILVLAHCERKLAAQARKSMLQIYTFQKPFGKFPHIEYFKIFDPMITPIPTYRADIWGYDYSDVIEQIHFKLCRTFKASAFQAITQWH